MRIEQNNQYFNQYTGLGTKSDKDSVQTFSVDSNDESEKKVNDKIKSDMLSKFTRVDNSRMPHIGLGVKLQTTDNGLSVKKDSAIEPQDDDTDFLELHKVKRDAMSGMINRLGINGEIRGISIETVPQNYSTYYIETEGAEKNIFVIELENGEFIFTETELDEEKLKLSLAYARADLGMNTGKLNVEELKKAFAKFFNVEELKDFVLEYWETKEKSASMSKSITA